MGNEHALSAAELAGTVWPEMMARLGALGPEILEAPYPRDERSTTDGVRYLTRLAVVALQWCVEFGDADFPAFYRHDDDVTKWGGPNVDNTYLRARVRGDAEYVLRGTTGHCHGFVISTHEGDMHLEQYGVYDELWHDALDVDGDGSFTLHLGGAPSGRNWMPLDERSTNVTIRQYFDDWATDVPESFHIERVGAPLAPHPLTSPALRARLDDAIEWIERSVRYWNAYIETALARGGWNAVAGAGSAAGGSRGIAYGTGFADLGEDEALIVEGDAPDAWTWNFLLYNLGWFESLDIANRVTSLNTRQIHIDTDGRFRIVIAHRDPGVQNWLDTTGLAQTMLTYRYIRTATSPIPTCRVVPFAGLRDALPATTPVFGPAQRAEQIATRRTHISRRFRG